MFTSEVSFETPGFVQDRWVIGGGANALGPP